MKYLNLLGGTKTFKVKKNNGSNGSSEYSNQCMWLSIIDFLNEVNHNTLTLPQIREIASSPSLNTPQGAVINGKLQEFDTDRHMDALLNIVNTFDLQIHLYVSFRNNTGNLIISDEPDWIIGNSSAPNVVSIVSYGAHFELITSIGERKLYGGVFEELEIDTSAKSKDNSNNYADFKPNIELASGKKIKKSIKPTEIANINKLLDIMSYLEHTIVNIQQNKARNERELKNLEESFIKDQKNIINKDVELQVSLVASYQEYKKILNERIKEDEEELIKLKKIKKSNESELSVYFN